MKKITLFILHFAFCNLHFAIFTHAQAPQSFNFQLIARDTAGLIFSNRILGLQISILQDSENGSTVYCERHTATTNKYGLVNIEIGTGTVVSGIFSAINWGAYSHFIKLEIDPAGGTGYFTMGTTPLVSVPYALYAANAGNVVDTSSTNELQALSISNDTVFLSNGGYVKLPPGLWSQSGNNIYNNNSGNVGIGTSTPAGKLIVKGDSLAPATEPLFEVKNKDGDPVLVVYPDSVRITFTQDAVSKANAQGGFAVSGRSSSKGATSDYLVITPDSARIYLNEYADKANAQGGFAVSGRSSSKGASSDYLSVNSDSVKISKSLYIPRMTTSERDNIGFVPSQGLIIYNLTTLCMQIYETGRWSNIWCFSCAPSVIQQPVDAAVCITGDTSFAVSAAGVNLAYRWQESSDGGSSWIDIVDGGTDPVYANAETNILSLSNIPVNLNGFKYRCVVSGSCNPVVFSNAATLNIGASDLVITSQPSNKELIAGCGAVFSIATSVHGQYRWQKSADGGVTWNNLSDGSASPVYSGTLTTGLTLANVPVTLSGDRFRCIINNPCGTGDTSEYATITVNTNTISATSATNIDQVSFSANWNVVPGATNYYLDVSESQNFSSFVPGFSNLNVNNVSSFSVTGLSGSTTYYYRVRANNFCRNENSNVISVTTPVFVLGDNFGGGKVFFTNGKACLIAATTDQSAGATWGCSGSNIFGAISSGIGYGMQNTMAIESGCTTSGIASDICANLSLGGYDDWFLPSREELKKLYDNSALFGNLTTTYWSSTQLISTIAFSVDFASGSVISNPKNNSYYVRAIRKAGGSFAIPPNNDCANAVVLNANTNCNPVVYYTYQATQSIAGCTGNADDDVWFKFVAVTSKPIITVTGTGAFNPVVDLRSGSCNGTSINCVDLTAAGGIETISTSGLTIGNTYYVRVYHSDAGDGGEGGIFSICITVAQPAVTTTSPSSVASYTATCGGNITDDGGAPVTVRGVCWNTIPNPTIANSKTSDGTGAGVFVSNITGLIPSTIYFVRAYAISAIGTSYGGVYSFTTVPLNDDCSGAIELVQGASAINGNTFGATLSVSDCSGNPDDEIWYKFTATSANPVINVTGIGGFDPYINLRNGPCNGASIDCSHSSVLNAAGLTIGNTYYIRIFHNGSGNGGGLFTISVNN